MSKKLSEDRFLADLYKKDAVQAAFLQRIIDAINSVAKSAGIAVSGDHPAPPPVNAISAKVSSGEQVHVTLSHGAEVNRAIHYFVEADTSPSFPQPHVMDIGSSRSHIFHLPSLTDSGTQQKWYLRAYAQYPGSKPSAPVVLGGLNNPTAVTLRGTTKLTPLPPTGSGTASTTGQQGGSGRGKQRVSTPKVIRVGKSQASNNPVQALQSAPASSGNLLHNYPTAYTLTGTWTNPQNAIDNNLATYTSATASTASVVYVASGFSSLSSMAKGNTLQVIAQAVAISGGSVLVEYSKDAGTSWTTLTSISAAQTSQQTYTAAIPLTVASQNVQVRVTGPGSSTGSTANATDYAGTGADDATVGTAVWANPTNAQGNQSSLYASISSATTSVISHYLKLTNFGFTIPAGATINGIQATATEYSNAQDDGLGNSISVFDSSVKLYKAGAISGTEHASAGSWPATVGTQVYGGTTDLWGISPLVADINNAGFGIGISVEIDRAGQVITGQARVYSVALTVYYTTSGGSASSQTRIYDIQQVLTVS